MKRTLLCILLFPFFSVSLAQHISDFNGLSDVGQDTDFHLPPTHTFQYLIQQDDALSQGGVMPGKLDYSGYAPVQGSSKFGYLCVNSEDAPGGVTILDIEFDDILGKWQIDASEAVEFKLDSFNATNTFATISNCSGTITPWGTMITCEETTSIETEAYCKIPGNEGKFRCLFFSERDNNGDGYDDFGWAIEIDPITKTIINQDGGRNDKDKLWAMGNFKHENAVIHANQRTVYQGADATNGEGYLFKFIANFEKNLSAGELYVYKGDKQSNHSWIKLNNTSKAEQNSTLEQCANVGATSFGGIEDVEISPVDNMIYFAVKRETAFGFSDKGVVYRFKDKNPLTGEGVENFELFAGGDRSYNGVLWGNGTDNLVFDNLGNLWVAQDESGSDRRNYIWVIDNGHTQSNPKVKIFAHTPKGSEPTGLTFSPDNKYIFMSLQHPNSTNNQTSQPDAFGKSVAFDKDITLVLARKENLNNNIVSAEKDLLITQYYNDENSNSKWLEIKNISGNIIQEGNYFLDLYRNSKLANISNERPSVSHPVPKMQIGEVILLKNMAKPLFPLPGNLGDATQIQSDVCTFDGDDIVLISSTPGNLKFNNRRDIIGNLNGVNWGSNTSFIRGGIAQEIPDRIFDAENWIELDSLAEINTADKNRNLALGTQVIGPTEWTGSNWNNLKPDRSRNVIITDTYNASEGGIQAFDLTVDSGVSLNFNDNQNSSNSLIIYKDLSILGSLTLGDTESLLLKGQNIQVNGVIDKIERSAVRNHKNDITYWSSMVDNDDIDRVFKGVNPERIFYYDQSKQLSTNNQDPGYWDAWLEASGRMIPGKGYAAEGPSNETGVHEIRFKGTPNYGTIEVSDIIFNNDQGANENEQNDFNLIGNPYPSAIDIMSFLDLNTTLNATIDGTVYFWTHATPIGTGGFSESDYVSYNFLGGVGVEDSHEIGNSIGSGQGFFVRAIKNDKVLFKPNMMIPDSNTQFFKSSSKASKSVQNKIWLNLKDSQGHFKQVLIGFSDMATDGMDFGYDALYFRTNKEIEFYSLLEQRKLSIQGLGVFNENKSVNLGFEIRSEDLEMTIKIDRVVGEISKQNVYLVDDELGIVHDLKSESYQFKGTDKGIFNERFRLQFSNKALFIEEDLETLGLFIQDGLLNVDAGVEIHEIRIYDIMGRSIHKGNPNLNKFTVDLENLRTGRIFIVQLKGENGSVLNRKMIR